MYLFHCSYPVDWFAIMYDASIKILVNISWYMSLSRSRIVELQGMFIFKFTVW